MLADHLLRRLVGQAIVVIRHAAARGDEDVTDPIADFGCDRAEEAGIDRFVARHDPGSPRLGCPPGSEHGIRSACLGVEVQHAGLAADDLHTVYEVIPVREQQLAVARDVDHAMVGGKKGACVRGKRPRERSGRGIHRLERSRPLVGFPAALVGDRVQFGRVEIHERSGMLRHEVCGDLRAVC